MDDAYTGQNAPELKQATSEVVALDGRRRRWESGIAHPRAGEGDIPT